MLTTIEATYENGHIIWQEQPPVQNKRKVLVTFLEETKELPKRRQAGSLKGKIQVPDNFNELLDDLNAYM